MVILDFISRHEAIRPSEEDAYVLEVKRQLSWVLQQVSRSVGRLIDFHWSGRDMTACCLLAWSVSVCLCVCLCVCVCLFVCVCV
jgi:hypothetical protein